MGYTASRWIRLAYWNLWPAIRLLLVLAALAVWLHRSQGLEPPSFYTCVNIMGGIAILFFLCALFSLARLYLALLWFPCYTVLVFHGLFYNGFRMMLRQLVGPRPACLEALCALAGELCLFMGLADSIASALKICCRF